MVLTDLPVPTTGDDKCVVQGNERAFTSNTIAKSRLVCFPDELWPVIMDDPRPSLDEWILDVIQKGRVLVKFWKRDWLQLEALGRKVHVDELLDCAFGKAGPVDGGEVCEDLVRCLVGWFINDSFRVGVQPCEVDDMK